MTTSEYRISRAQVIAKRREALNGIKRKYGIKTMFGQLGLGKRLGQIGEIDREIARLVEADPTIIPQPRRRTVVHTSTEQSYDALVQQKEELQKSVKTTIHRRPGHIACGMGMTVMAICAPAPTLYGFGIVSASTAKAAMISFATVVLPTLLTMQVPQAVNNLTRMAVNGITSRSLRLGHGPRF